MTAASHSRATALPVGAPRERLALPSTTLPGTRPERAPPELYRDREDGLSDALPRGTVCTLSRWPPSASCFRRAFAFPRPKARSATGCTQIGVYSLPRPRDGRVRAIGPSAAQLAASQPARKNCPYVFPSDAGDGCFTAARFCHARLFATAKIEGATPHTLRHTFGSAAGCSERCTHHPLTCCP